MYYIVDSAGALLYKSVSFLKSTVNSTTSRGGVNLDNRMLEFDFFKRLLGRIIFIQLLLKVESFLNMESCAELVKKTNVIPMTFFK